MKNYLLLLFFLCLIPAVFSQDEGKFKGHGNEPFWDIKFQGEELIFHKMGEKDLHFIYTGPFKAEGFKTDFIKIYYLTKNKKSFVIIKDCDGKCSDNMSDVLYPYELIIKIDDTFYYGCGEYEK